MNLAETLAEYWGLLLFLIIIAIIVVKYRLDKTKAKKEEELEEPPAPPKEMTFNDLLFGENSEQLLDNLLKQKKKAETELEGVRLEGKKLVAEEQAMEKDYNTRKAQIAKEKDELGYKHTTWLNQLAMTEQMIKNQESMLKKLKKKKVEK